MYSVLFYSALILALSFGPIIILGLIFFLLICVANTIWGIYTLIMKKLGVTK